jgi:hypothetical protein
MFCHRTDGSGVESKSSSIVRTVYQPDTRESLTTPGEHAPNLSSLGGGDGGRNLPIFSFLILDLIYIITTSAPS